MALNKMLAYITGIERSHSLSLVQIKSDGGIRKAQRRGPYLYNFTVGIQPMFDDSNSYYEIQAELQAIQYGVSTITTQMPATEVKNRGAWTGSPVVDVADQTGTTVNLKGFSDDITGVVRDGDWVQFSGDTKVYQVVGNADSDSNGKVSITLNTPLIKSPANEAIVSTGNTVEFKLALVLFSDATKTPASNINNIANWGSFVFEEVL